MAVKVSVYGTANMRQIENARKELDKLERDARKSASGFRGSMNKLGSAATSTGSKIASGLASAAVGKWLKGSIDVAKKAQQSQEAFKNAVMATNGVVDNSKVAGEAAAKTTLEYNKAQTGAAIAHNLAAQALKKHGANSLQYKNAVNSANLADMKATAAAKKNKDAQLALANAVKRTSINWDDYEAKAKSVLTQQSEISAYSKGQLRGALTELTTTTGDANLSLELLAVTTDLARRKNMDIGKAAVQVGRAYNGNTTALKRMGIEMPKGAKGMEVIDALQKRVAGSAKTYGDSASGAQDKYKNSMKSLQSQVGTALMPALTSLMKSLASIASRFQQLSPNTQNVIVKFAATTAAILLLMPYFDKLGKAIKGIYSASKTAIVGLINLAKGMMGNAAVAEGQTVPAMRKVGLAIRSGAKATLDFVKNLAIKTGALVKSGIQYTLTTAKMLASKAATFAVSAATKAAAAAQWLLNAAMSANPIGLVVLAIVALVAVVVLAWKRNEKFREVITKAWNAIKNAGMAVWNWLSKIVPETFKKLVDFAKKWSLPGIIYTHWSKIKDGAVQAWNAVINFFKGVPGKILKALGSFGSLLKNIGYDLVAGLQSGIQKAWTWLTDKLKGMVNLLPDVVKKVLGIKSPSRVFMTLGQQIGQGMEVGILGTKANIEAATGRVANSAIAGVQRYQEKLRALRDRTSELMGSWGIGETVQTETITPDAMLTGIKSQAKTMQGFLKNIETLKKSKLSSAVVASVMALGPAQGAAQAAALTQMTPAQIAQYNATYAAQRRAASGLATTQLGPARAPAPVTIASGAVQVKVNIAGNASEHDVRAAVNKAFDQLAKELRAK